MCKFPYGRTRTETPSADGVARKLALRTSQPNGVKEPPVNIQEITIIPIGHVENQFDAPTAGNTIRAEESQLVIKPEFLGGLDGIEAGHEILVIFHFHLAEPRGYNLHQHPRGNQSRPKQGVFALRSPYRPNHIGVTQAKIVSIEGNTLTVTGLDAINQTPILDLKRVG